MTTSLPPWLHPWWPRVKPDPGPTPAQLKIDKPVWKNPKHGN